MDDLDRLSALRNALRRRLGAERYQFWLGDRTHLEVAGHTLRVICATRTELVFLRRRIHHALAECCHALWSPPPAIAYEELNGSSPTIVAPPAAADAPSHVNGSAQAPTSSPPAPARPAVRTFENFSVGAGNHRGVQAALDLARQPGRFTPLLLHGPSGCGKTHVLEAVSHAARGARGRVRCLMITGEQFTAQFLDALNSRALPGFRHKLRSVELLLVDDVQFFGNKKATLEELLYTIDALHGRQGQVVLTSDRPVAELRAMNAELGARLASGLTVALDLPDYATRVGIVRSTAERLNVDLESAVVEVVARQVAGSARLLSGAINRLSAASRAASQALTVEFAERELADFCLQHAPQVRLPDIQRAVCEEFGVEPATLRSSRRTRAAAEPRMLCMWLARRYTRAALSEIGEYFGGRQHSTVISAKRKFDDLLTSGGEIVVGDRPCQVEDALRRIEARLRTG
jgi:chromosomal replication initiator protein